MINKNVKLFLIDKKYVNITASEENMQKIMLVFSTSLERDETEEKDVVLVSELTNMSNINTDNFDNPSDTIDSKDLDYSDDLVYPDYPDYPNDRDRDSQAAIGKDVIDDTEVARNGDNFTGAYQGIRDITSLPDLTMLGDYSEKVLPEDENFSYYDTETVDGVSANNIALFAKCLPVQRPYRKINPPTLRAILLDNIAYSMDDPAVLSIVKEEEIENKVDPENVDTDAPKEKLITNNMYDFEFIPALKKKLEQFTSSSDSSASIQLIIFIAILIILVIYLLIQGMLGSESYPTNNLPYN